MLRCYFYPVIKFKNMRHLIFILISLTVLISCQKEINIQNESAAYLQNIEAALKDSINNDDYRVLDFSRAVLTSIKDDEALVLRIPFKNKIIRNDFVLLQLEKNGAIKRGKIIHLDGGERLINTSGNKAYRFDGNIKISSLDRKFKMQSEIVNGFISAFHPQERGASLGGVEELPEVVIICGGNSSGGGISWSDWMSLMSLFNDINYFSYYSNMDGSGGGVGGGGGSGGSGGSSGSNNNSNGGISTTSSIHIDYDSYVSRPAIDIAKYLNCFGSVPDGGANCSITIYTDIPVNGDPSEFFNWQTGSPGHTFLSFSKSNLGQSVQQVFGWYPSQSWEAMATPAPIDGKFVDDAGHEFNASLTISVTPQQLQSAITEVLYLSHSIKYDVDEYNCTDFALEVFNIVRDPRNVIEIPMYDIPGGMAPNGTATPNGLYDKLKDMKAANGADASNINLPLIGWAGNGHGACN